MNDDPLLMPRDIARRLGRSHWTVYSWIRNGNLPEPDQASITQGGHTRRLWRASTVDAWWGQWWLNPTNKAAREAAATVRRSRPATSWDDLPT